MLALTRKVNEAIIIETPGGEKIRLSVVVFHGARQVKLGFEADRKIKIYREELANGSKSMNVEHSTLNIQHPIQGTNRECPSEK
jgi:carbon storage regulator CsrA